MGFTDFLNPISTVAGAGISSLGGKSAAKTQAKSQQAALDYQRQKDAQARAEWEKAMQIYTANRNALLQRYGLSVPDMGQPGGIPGAVPRAGMEMAGGMPPGGAGPQVDPRMAAAVLQRYGMQA